MKEKKLYLVSAIMKKAMVTTLWRTQEIELSWIDWQIWAIPIFEDYKKALKYADGNKDVIEELTIIK